jgi:hypothetical protein
MRAWRSAFGTPSGLEPKGEVAFDRHVRPERQVLKHHPDATGLRCLEDPPIRRHDLIADHDCSFVRGDKTGNEPQHRGLTAPRWPEQHHALGGLNPQRKIPQH